LENLDDSGLGSHVQADKGSGGATRRDLAVRVLSLAETDESPQFALSSESPAAISPMAPNSAVGEAEASFQRPVESEPSRQRRPVREWVGLGAVVLLAAGLRLWRLDQNGFGNTYYAAAVRSMLVNWTNFFFGSFDPAGLVTVDKPPVAIWLQALSAKMFGFRGLSLLVPEALLGVASVLLTYHLVRRLFGAGAGLLAGLFLAITPVCVAVDRDNMPDPALVFVLLLAAWSLNLAAETGRLKFLLLATALVGVGFNVKMLAAFVVLPTFYVCYFVSARVGWRAKLGQLTAATVVLVAVSLSWSIAVELTPKDRRPYIGGSRNNSALDLALGYNGIGRILGGRGNMGPPGSRPFPVAPPSRKVEAGADAKAPRVREDEDAPPARDRPPDIDQSLDRKGRLSQGGPSGWFPPGEPIGPGGPGPGGGPGMFGGTPGFLRFTRPLMAGQITWLFPIAVLGALVAAARAERRWPLAPGPMALLLWAGWLGTHWVVFSFARGIFHEYYTMIMGPAIAALAGIGTVTLYDEWRRGRGHGYLPLALILTASWQAYIAYEHPEVRRWLLPLLGTGTVLSLVGLIAARWRCARRESIPWVGLATGIGLATLLIGPGYWSTAPSLAPGFSMLPAAQPPSRTRGRDDIRMPPGPPFGLESESNERLVEFLRANRHGERIFVATPSSMEAASIIIRTGEAAVSLGGFMGADPVLTKDEFERLVESGQVRFVLFGGGPGGPPPGGGMPFAFPGMPGGPAGGPPFPPGGPGGRGNSELFAWVREHGKVVDGKLWKAAEPKDEHKPDQADDDHVGPEGRPTTLFRFMRGMTRLYDCNPSEADWNPRRPRLEVLSSVECSDLNHLVQDMVRCCSPWSSRFTTSRMRCRRSCLSSPRCWTLSAASTRSSLSTMEAATPAGRCSPRRPCSIRESRCWGSPAISGTRRRSPRGSTSPRAMPWSSWTRTCRTRPICCLKWSPGTTRAMTSSRPRGFRARGKACSSGPRRRSSMA
jgi:4-amino-4-deoxy-L-arabinose transferase-like glycosyltransferase